MAMAMSPGNRSRVGHACGDSRTVLVGDDLPELGSDLVAALASLDVDDLAHGCWRWFLLNALWRLFFKARVG